ncbi:hypothetical protein K1719_025404 [Acacia pycnantha]|nr:hypothetical protein K1719_025404 [Acacia pycnantha]
MSDYDNVVVGKLKLKGKALDVKFSGIKKKKKKHDKSHGQLALINQVLKGRNRSLTMMDCYREYLTSAHHVLSGNTLSTGLNEVGSNNQAASYDDILTPAERRFLQQTEKLELQRLTKMASKSHRDRIQEFNQYLANLSEHYDIPKVGPG